METEEIYPLAVRREGREVRSNKRKSRCRLFSVAGFSLEAREGVFGSSGQVAGTKGSF